MDSPHQRNEASQTSYEDLEADMQRRTYDESYPVNSGPTNSNSGPMNDVDVKLLTATNISERHAFMFKVFQILFVQLFTSFGVVAIFVLNRSVQQFVLFHPGILLLTIILSFAFLLSILCCRGASSSYPLNYLLLGGFTICEAILLGVISSAYETKAVFFAFLITVFVTVALMSFALQTKFDFTGMGVYLLVILVVLVIAGFIRMFMCRPGQCEVAEIVYASVGALLFSVFIIYHMQLIIGGNHEHQFSTDEYVFAALSMYLNIINLFSFILILFGRRSG
jgi:hypothetical protein